MIKISNNLPAFNENDIKIPLSLVSGLNNKTNYKVKIYNAWGATNSLLASGNLDTNSDPEYLICESLDYEEGKELKINCFYKIQIYSDDNKEQSNFGIAKCIATPNTTISLDDNLLATFTYNKESSEDLYSVKFILLKNNSNIESSDDIICYHNFLNSNEEVIQYQFYYPNFEAEHQYQVKAQYTTITGYKNTAISNEHIAYNNTVEDNSKLQLSYSLDNAYLIIQAFIPIADKTTLINPMFFKKDLEEKDCYIPLGEGNVLETAGDIEAEYKIYQFKDYGIKYMQPYGGKKGYEYVFICQKQNNNGELSNIVISNHTNEAGQEILPESNYTKFDDMFLYDNEKQLRLCFNPKISSYKINTKQQKVEIIGNKFPYFVQSGSNYYKEFNISGLISQEMDNEMLFIQKYLVDSGRIEKRENTIYNFNDQKKNEEHYNVDSVEYDKKFINEKYFREEVLAWLNNGKPKVFKSPTEGNYIVFVSGVSMSPEEKLGRMLYNVSCTVTEIEEYNLINLKKMNLLKTI